MLTATRRRINVFRDWCPAFRIASSTSSLQVMYEKRLLTRKPQGRAFQYAPKATQEKTLGKMLGDLLGRAFDGSSSTLVQHLLQHSSPDKDELAAIREAIESYEKDREDE